MKTFAALSVLLLIVSSSYAQEFRFTSGREKQKGNAELFSDISAKSHFKQVQIEKIMSYQLNDEVKTDLSNGVQFIGKVSAITNDAPGLQTIIIQSTTVEGLVLSVSKIEIPNQEVQYRGVLISPRHRDMILLEKDLITGRYGWNKNNVANLIAD
jgi:hypothetical protein